MCLSGFVVVWVPWRKGSSRKGLSATLCAGTVGTGKTAARVACSTWLQVSAPARSFGCCSGSGVVSG